MADYVPQLLFTADAAGRLDFVNRRCCEYSGFPIGRLIEVTGASLRQFIHVEDFSRAVSQVQISIATGERLEIELRLRKADGEFRWFLIRAVPSLDDLGNVCAWFGSATDIDDLKHTEDVVRSLETLNTAKEAVEDLGLELLDPLASLEELLESALIEPSLSQQVIRYLLQARHRVLNMEKRVSASLNRQSYVTMRKISDFYKPEQIVEKTALYMSQHDCGLPPEYVALDSGQRFPPCDNCMRLRYKVAVKAPQLGDERNPR
jgi:PAS domain S-box-containing protein